MSTKRATRCRSCHNRYRGQVGLVSKGKHHYNWLGGRRKNRGYIFIYVPYHPCINKRMKIIGEHRLVIEAKLNNVSLNDWIETGRNNSYKKNAKFLKSTDVIHHINGKTDDNRIENLTITTRHNHEYQTLLKIAQKRIKELEKQVQSLENKGDENEKN
ncbi:MAG: hypothetical protein ACTSWD_12875 [Candidatus Heimdallarchaeota archaeon]